jgi:hypothetical protein
MKWLTTIAGLISGATACIPSPYQPIAAAVTGILALIAGHRAHSFGPSPVVPPPTE